MQKDPKFIRESGYSLPDNRRYYYAGDPDPAVMAGAVDRLNDALPGLSVRAVGKEHARLIPSHGYQMLETDTAVGPYNVPYNVVYMLVGSEAAKQANIRYVDVGRLSFAISGVVGRLGLGNEENVMTINQDCAPNLVLYPALAENKDLTDALKVDQGVQEALYPVATALIVAERMKVATPGISWQKTDSGREFRVAGLESTEVSSEVLRTAALEIDRVAHGVRVAQGVPGGERQHAFVGDFDQPRYLGLRESSALNPAVTNALAADERVQDALRPIRDALALYRAGVEPRTEGRRFS